MRAEGVIGGILFVACQLAAIATFGFLTFFDGFHYTWWNWFFVLPINGILGTLWPLYWAVFRPFFH